MRFVVELVTTDDRRVEGSIAREGLDEPITFSGWLELLGLLEEIERRSAPPSGKAK